MISGIATSISQLPSAVAFIQSGLVGTGEVIARGIPLFTTAIEACYDGGKTAKAIRNYRIVKAEDIPQNENRTLMEVLTSVKRFKTKKIIRKFTKGIESIAFFGAAVSAFVYTLSKVKLIALPAIQTAGAYFAMMGGLSIAYTCNLLRGIARLGKAIGYIRMLDPSNELAMNTAKAKLKGALLLISTAILGIGMCASFWFGGPVYLFIALALATAILDIYRHYYDEHRKGRLNSEKDGVIQAALEHNYRSYRDFFKWVGGRPKAIYNWYQGRHSVAAKVSIAEINSFSKEKEKEFLRESRITHITKLVLENESYKRQTKSMTSSQRKSLAIRIAKHVV
jgi:hypothetical protein